MRSDSKKRYLIIAQIMNTKTVIFLFVVSLLYSCAGDAFVILKELPFTRQVGGFIKLEECSKLYESDQISIIEVHCDNKDQKDGIYVISLQGRRYFNWFAPQFNAWAWNEGCNSDSGCYYRAKLDDTGKISELEYHYYINLSEGSYRLKIENGELVIKENYNKDAPS